MQHSVWASAFLDRPSEVKLRSFFINLLGFQAEMVMKDLHTTVYHARRPLFGLADYKEKIAFTVSGSELRVMAMTPGGENRREDVDPMKCPIGLRIRRANGASAPVEQLRDRFYEFETPRVLGAREPSHRRRSAFGARSYQPHITVLRAGAITNPDLSALGAALRTHIDSISFDRLVVRCRSR